jgi:Putative restriction endonuclease
MSEPALHYRWSPEGFVRAWDVGAFDRRVELIEGEIWPVIIGDWHGETVGRVIKRLPDDGVRVTTATLPVGDSLPDPDCWVLRRGAQPIARLGARLQRWSSADVLLVVEVSDESVIQDLTTKARLYGGAGYPVYWVITREALFEHTGPIPHGYRTRVEYRNGDIIRVPYADGVVIAVDDLVTAA